MLRFVAILIVAIFAVPVLASDAPHVVKDEAGPDACEPGDPLGPCPGRRLTVKNPKRRRVWVHIGCGPEVMTTVHGPIPRRSYTIFEVTPKDVPNGLSKGQCRVDKWSYKKEDVEHEL